MMYKGLNPPDCGMGNEPAPGVYKHYEGVEIKWAAHIIQRTLDFAVYAIDSAL